MNDGEQFRAELAAGHFMINYCDACGAFSAPDATACHACGSIALCWRPATGSATVVSWAIVPPRRAATGSTASADVVIIAEFREGPWWWGRLAASDGRDLRVGAALKVTSTTSEDGSTLPMFELTDRRNA